jgi:hypothetical protein
MLATGRRTCELLNGRSTFAVVGEHEVHFTGQAKRRRADGGYHIPTLARAADVADAHEAVKCLQGKRVRTNRETSLCYQSALGRQLRLQGWGECGRVHGLRGVYACMATTLFDCGDASDAYAAMCMLGHAGIEESLVYTPFHLGDDFALEPRMGCFTPSAEAAPSASDPREPPA